MGSDAQKRALERMATDIDHAAEGKPLIRAQKDRLRMAAHLLREQARQPDHEPIDRPLSACELKLEARS